MKTTLTCAALLISSFTSSLFAQETKLEATTLQTQVAEKVQVLDTETESYADFEFTNAPQYFILYYSASWCPPCRKMAPDSVKFYNDEVAKIPEVELIMVSADRTKDAALKWAKQHKMPWPTIMSSDAGASKIVQNSSPNGIPHMVLVDGEGKVILRGHPGSIKKALKKNLAEIKEGKAPTPAKTKTASKDNIPADEIF